jgi:hypothetical protein
MSFLGFCDISLMNFYEQVPRKNWKPNCGALSAEMADDDAEDELYESSDVKHTNRPDRV